MKTIIFTYGRDFHVSDESADSVKNILLSEVGRPEFFEVEGRIIRPQDIKAILPVTTEEEKDEVDNEGDDETDEV